MSDLPEGTVLWLVVLAVMGVLFLVVIRRMSVLIARTQSLERFQKSVDAINVRLGATAEPFVGQLDEIRRRSGDPQVMAEALPGTQDTLRALAAEARVLKAPAQLVPLAQALAVELDRAVRAADLVDHGLGALIADRRGGRDLEAQTSLKRGALNMRHAREATGRIAAQVAAVRPADLLDPHAVPVRTPSTTAMPTYLVDADLDPDVR
jgi:hypothetical protein